MKNVYAAILVAAIISAACLLMPRAGFSDGQSTPPAPIVAAVSAPKLISQAIEYQPMDATVTESSYTGHVLVVVTNTYQVDLTVGR
jgi:hypothetical protein